MKKLITILLAAAALFVSCGDINNINKNNNDNSATLEISLGSSSRTVAPAVDIKDEDIKNVEQWNITLTNQREIVKEETVTPDENGKISLKIVPGTYVVEIEGTITKDSVEYKLCGTVKSCEVSEDGAKISIPVGLKRTAEGKGSLKYTLSISDKDFLADLKTSDLSVSGNNLKAGNYTFAATLANILDKEAKEISLPVTGVLDTESKLLKLTFAKEEIVSGYYCLSVICSYTEGSETTDLELQISDFMVEIDDNLASEGTCELKKVENSAIKIFYASVDSADKKNNGLSPAKPKEFYSLLSWLAENPEDYKTAYIITSSEDSIQYDISSNPTKAGSKNKVLVRDEKNPLFTLKDGKLYLPTAEDFGETLPQSFILNLKSSKSDDVAYIEFGDEFRFLGIYLNKIRAVINGCTMTKPNICCYGTGISTEYVKNVSVPVFTVNFAADTTPEFDSYSYEYKDYSDESYSALAVYDEAKKQVKVYSRSTGTATISIKDPLADFVSFGKEISSESNTIAYEVPEIEGATYTWYINEIEIAELKDLTTFTIDTNTNKNLIPGTNIIKCVVKVGSEYASVTDLIEV